MPRIATYTRISTDEVNQPYSLGAQAERLAAYVASQEDCGGCSVGGGQGSPLG